MPTKAEEIEFILEVRKLVDERWGNGFSYLSSLLEEAAPLWTECIRGDKLGSPVGDLWDYKSQLRRENDDAQAALETTRAQVREAQNHLAALGRQARRLAGDLRATLAGHNALVDSFECASAALVR